MAAKNHSLILTLEPALYANVTSLAKTNGTTRSTAARELIRAGIGCVEDVGSAALAAKREASAKGRRWLRHDEVWR